MTYPQIIPARTYATVGAGLIAMSYGLARFAFGLYVPAIRGELGLSADVTGVIGSMAFVSFSAASLFASSVSANLGARGAAILASLLGFAGLLLISLATGAWTLGLGVFACGVCTGLMMPALTAGMQTAVSSVLHGRVSAVMNAGTSIGVVVSVPMVILLAEHWRAAYQGFAVVALMCVLAALVYVPPIERGRSALRAVSGMTTVLRRRLARLMLFGLGMGLVSSTYWVFAPDLAVAAGGLDPRATGWMWLALGLAGLGGAAAGDLIDRFGAAASQGAAFAVMALSLLLLALGAESSVTAVLSAGIFGLVYMMLTGIYLVAGVRLLPDRQSLGAVVPFLAIAVGQALGSPATGALVTWMGHLQAFVVMAVVGLIVAAAYRWFPETRSNELRNDTAGE